MSFQPIKFYQTGTFTVGNRLLDPEARSVQANMQRTNSLSSGHRACQGCGEALGARYAIDAAMNATRDQLIAAARSQLDASLEDWVFAATVREGFTEDERADILGLLWEVIYADGSLARLEESLLHRLSRLF